MTVLKEYTCEEVGKHNKENDCWVIFEDKVLDLTSWVHKHPAGKKPILALAGLDATDEINAVHGKHVGNSMVNAFVIGKVTDIKLPPHVIEFRSLVKSIVDDAEWMTPDPLYLAKRFGLIVPLFAISVFLYLSNNFIACHVLGGLLLGLVWQQLLLVGHDCGHRSAVKSFANNYYVGWFVGTLMNGFCLEWWNANHNTHHIATNSVEHDPDIQHLPFIAISELFFNNIFSTYYNCTFEFGRVAKIFVSVQHFLFYPILTMSRLFIHVQSALHFFDFKNKFKSRPLEAVGFIGYFAWVYMYVVVVGGNYGRSSRSMFAYWASAHVFATIIHIQITLNHFASPVHSDAANPGPRGGKDFVHAQLYGTCDIACPEWMDWFHGGLQFQVEHHLIPHVPRHNLRKLSAVIQRFALKHKLPYEARTFTQALECVQGKLTRVGSLAYKQASAEYPTMMRIFRSLSNFSFGNLPFYD